jgi:ABC-type transport system involved in multi-copper enzyme maturation permease subunit
LVIGLLIALSLTILSTLINLNDYTARQQDYLSAQESLKGNRFRIRIYRPPQPLSVLAQGHDRSLGNQLETTYLRIPARTSGYMGSFASQHLRFLSGFSAVDFTFLIRVVLSLLVIFLAYNTISEEKSRGTLKLALSNALPRDQVLLGKFLGGLFIVFGALTLSFLTVMIILLVHPAFNLTGPMAIRILVMWGISGLYLVCFYSMSLLVSVAVNRPAVSLMVLLQIWIFLIILYPNLGTVAAKNMIRLPKDEEIALKKEAVFKPYETEYREIQNAFYESVRSRHRTPPEIGLKYIELTSKRAQMEFDVDMEFSRRLSQQAETAQNIAILSPAVLLDRVMIRLARTGMTEFDQFMAGVKRYWDGYVENYKLRYIDFEAYRSSPLPPFSFPSESIAEAVGATALSWIILAVFSVLFFLIAYVTFLRKDIR